MTRARRAKQPQPASLAQRPACRADRTPRTTCASTTQAAAQRALGAPNCTPAVRVKAAPVWRDAVSLPRRPQQAACDRNALRPMMSYDILCCVVGAFCRPCACKIGRFMGLASTQ
jgi:hypothetical protein